MQIIRRWNMIVTVKMVVITLILIEAAILLMSLMFRWELVYPLVSLFVIGTGIAILQFIRVRTYHYPLIRRTRQLHAKLVRFAGNTESQPRNLHPIKQFNRSVTRSVVVPSAEKVDVYILLTGNLGIDSMFWSDSDEQQIVNWFSSYNLHFVEREELSRYKRIVHLRFEVSS